MSYNAKSSDFVILVHEEVGCNLGKIGKTRYIYDLKMTRNPINIEYSSTFRATKNNSSKSQKSSLYGNVSKAP